MKRAIQVLITTAIIGWIVVSFMFIAGEAPVDMSFGHFALAKGAGFASIILAVLVARQLIERGIMITPNDDENDDW